ncbi:AraC family transcriptional regulator [Elstera litoralis]|uniref:AraC family transcriptional regulator n=1 Tax=Elstera litoralis TaxID=552518 RepID=A0A0F3IWD7_9PROT|nr:AraC family transcriptional regulator [Elstera litoralis]KJV10868.1 AraC family transcriptional regulator [Elstera litoralis]
MVRPYSPPAACNVLAAAASGVVEFIENQGGNAESVLHRAGIDVSWLTDPTLPLDLAAYVQMMEESAAQTGNGNFGLWYGQQFLPQNLGLIGGVTLAAPTLLSALEALAGLFPYHQQVTHTAFREAGGMVALEYRILDGAILARRQDAELTMGMFVNVLRAVFGPAWSPEEVHFEHPRPEQTQEHARAFQAPLHWGQRTNALIFKRPADDIAMPGADVKQMDRLRRQLLHAAHGSAGEVPLIRRVQAEIRSRLVDGTPYIEDVAEALNIRRWTLQRALADEGVSFSDMVERVRHQLARLYVQQTHVPIADIAFLLGYSEISAFSRAFTRWFDHSPRQFRAQAPRGG